MNKIALANHGFYQASDFSLNTHSNESCSYTMAPCMCQLNQYFDFWSAPIIKINLIKAEENHITLMFFVVILNEIQHFGAERL